VSRGNRKSWEELWRRRAQGRRKEWGRCDLLMRSCGSIYGGLVGRSWAAMSDRLRPQYLPLPFLAAETAP
jgi:hypothetical protein